MKLSIHGLVVTGDSKAETDVDMNDMLGNVSSSGKLGAAGVQTTRGNAIT